MSAGLILTTSVFAQSAPFPDPAAELSQTEDSPADPITAAERSLILEENESAPAPSVSSVGTILRMVLTLALAAAAIYGVIYFIKRASRRAEVKDPFLKILASAHLGSNRYAHVVAVGSRAWLLGAAESGVHLISEIEDKDILNAMFLEDSRKSAETPSGRFLDFKTMLRRLGIPVESGTSAADNIRKRRERLKGL
ncbi:MAG: flagellar biosynthetic protein FliO [Treponema sp.]|nr:flagellar biosynthetic protein FliO [Treponema sp.]